MTDKEIKEKVAEIIWECGEPLKTEVINNIHTLYLSYFREIVEGMKELSEEELEPFTATHSLSLIDKYMRGEPIKICVDDLLKAQLKSCQEQLREKLK